MKLLYAALFISLIGGALFLHAQLAPGTASTSTNANVKTTNTTQLSSPRFLFSSDFNGNKVRGYFVNASTGALKASGQFSTHTGPTRVAADKGGFRLYVINQGSKNLDAYFINRTTGHLSLVPGSPFAIGKQPTDVYVHPSGHFVYVTTQANELFAFAVQSNGSLRAVAGSPFSIQSSGGALVIDPQGKYLYVSDYATNNMLDAFSISSTVGALTPVPGSPYKQPTSPYCANGAWDIAVHPSGNFLIVPNMCEGIVVYRISRTTGTLKLISGSPFPVPYPPGPVVQSIAMDPRGQYFWVSTQYCHSGCSQSTDTWKFNATTGVPTYLESGQGACGLLVRSDPSGKFLYEVGDTDPNSNCAMSGLVPAIWGVSINRTNGTIKNIPGSPFSSPNPDSPFLDGLAVTP
jgi:6-phosphogluconolactonase